MSQRSRLSKSHWHDLYVPFQWNDTTWVLSLCHLCHRPLLYFSLIRNGPPPMSTLVPAWRGCRCCSYAGSLRGTYATSAQTSNWHSETQISSLELSPSCHHVARWWWKAWCLDTRGFILKKIQWHIHAGLWSLVNCWQEALTRHYIRCSWILMNAAVGLMDGLRLDGDRCIRVIPRQYSCLIVIKKLSLNKKLWNNSRKSSITSNRKQVLWRTNIAVEDRSTNTVNG